LFNNNLTSIDFHNLYEASILIKSLNIPWLIFEGESQRIIRRIALLPDSFSTPQGFKTSPVYHFREVPELVAFFISNYSEKSISFLSLMANCLAELYFSIFGK